MVDPGPSGDRLRRRIDWMAGQAEGPRVLDAARSEGILGLLLARRGVEVTVVEADPEAVEYAREVLAKEPAEVRERVDLVHGDFSGPAAVRGPFDTVILGDILQLAGSPGAVLDDCLEYLRPEGWVAITIALGLGPGDDHRQATRLTDIIDLLEPRLALHVMEIEDGHVRFVGRLSEDRQASWQRLDSEAVLSMTEAALAASQLRVQELERQAQIDGVALSQNKIAVSQFKERLDAKSGEVRVLRHRLQATYASTSFRAGSALVRAAKRPWTLWKLPFHLVGLYRSASRPSTPLVESSDSTDTDERYKDLPPDMDASQFISFPPLSLPEARVEGPPIAAILDTFTECALQYEINLVLLSRDGWRSQIEETRPACLLVESAFSGNSGEWRHWVLRQEKLEHSPLRDLLRYCRSQGIPTVFWNKEDPPHFDDFIGAAREFDYVFTTDADCVPLYRQTLGHDRVYVLPFAAQPRIHNPAREDHWPRYSLCFAGSWVDYKFPERGEALPFLLDSALPLGLHIFDRNLTRPEMRSNYRFPDKYRDAIKGTLTYREMLTAYRCYDVMLNVNTVTESPTMFSRRVFEVLACGATMISSDSVGMRRMLEGHARVARSMEEATDHLVDLLGSSETRIREAHLAYRYIHENHTYRHRMDELFRKVGLGSLIQEPPPVSVLMPTKRPQNVLRCLENFNRQEYHNKELILILNNAEFDLDAVQRDVGAIPNVQVLHVEGRTTLGDCLNRGVEAASGKYIAKMDDDDLYGERYLSDSFLASSFSGAEIVGKGMHFVYLEALDTTALLEKWPEHTFTVFVRGATLFIREEVAGEISFDSISIREDTNFQLAAAQAGCKIYSADRFNFMQVRTRQISDHTTQTSDSEVLKECREHTPGLDLGRAMI